jgi:ribonuclease VapC
VSLLDASALLAFQPGEDGPDLVEQALIAGASSGAADWAEVAQKVLASGHKWELAATPLATYGLDIEAVSGALASDRGLWSSAERAWPWTSS